MDTISPPHSFKDASMSPPGRWNAAIFIIALEVAERFAYYGVAGNLITYLTNNLHQPLGVASKNVNLWIGVTSMFPLLGAVVADSYIGRFNTILLSSLIYLMGMILLTLSVSVIPPNLRGTVFMAALYIMGVGEAGHKPCVQTFAADQFDESNPKEKAEKLSFFNWWYFGIVAGASTAVLVVTYVQENIGWTLGLSVLVGVLGVALMMFLMGVTRYRKQPAVGSPCTRIAQVVVAAIRKRHVKVNEEVPGSSICYVDCGANGRLLARTHQFRFLDKAFTMDGKDMSSTVRNPWRLCSVNQVEEAKQVLRLGPICLSSLMFAAVTVQSHTFFIKQGSTMVRSIGPNFSIPAASLQAFTGIGILAAVFLYDRVFVPATRKISGHPSGITTLQRIGFGLSLTIVEMVVAALVEGKRLRVARDHELLNSPMATIPISVWWLLPQYVINGFADLFAVVGLQELFYEEAPEALRSMGAAQWIGIIGAGSFLSGAIIAVVQKITAVHGGAWLGSNVNTAHINHFYWVLAALSALNLCVYVWVAKGYVYKTVENEECIENP